MAGERPQFYKLAPLKPHSGAIAHTSAARRACYGWPHAQFAQRLASPSPRLHAIRRYRSSAPIRTPSALSPPAAEAVSPALRDQLATLLASARDANKAFLTRGTEARRLVVAAHDAAVPSDAWAAANEALAELDTSRTDLAVAQDRLERLFIDDRLAHAIEDGNRAGPARPIASAIAAARDEVLGMAAAQDAELDDLKGRMPG